MRVRSENQAVVVDDEFVYSSCGDMPSSSDGYRVWGKAEQSPGWFQDVFALYGGNANAPGCDSKKTKI